MSTGCECEFITITVNDSVDWFYILEDHDAPKNSWDWHEYATAFGPFGSEEIANQHLCDNHANPGGAFINDSAQHLGDLTGPLAALIHAAMA